MIFRLIHALRTKLIPYGGTAYERRRHLYRQAWRSRARELRFQYQEGGRELSKISEAKQFIEKVQQEQDRKIVPFQRRKAQ
jgi:hypothetical protein